MLPSETMIWQPEFTDKTLSRKTGAVQRAFAQFFAPVAALALPVHVEPVCVLCGDFWRYRQPDM
ncbi:hypothetical protein BX42_23360 [Escherichia coli O145:NM str. 2010C-3507]|nr:hypothetical protein BX48_09580 [Escherichia coli O145:NM str. 2010C-3517]EYV26775.1 hypothetical protein BX47_21580 [Escherichia coli O145:NM str. 2010C-3516]EYV39127.1 hypothetical protein BX45_20080 [Escherichia coli O145:NM str. 2010C-3510]EYV51027.1 hypothetical protein BX42_23360 [Escherichia coli O145:NM str. 2010C-3507]EZE90766.1 hypothetical protein BX43_05805 [Escherichia coli O145:NM str. 2010C-3508]KDM77819.1 transposase [Escherichia coli]